MINNLTHSGAPPMQLRLDIGIQVEKVVEGVEMGVFDNGISYLTQRGLAEFCGSARSSIFRITQEWKAAQESGIFSSKRIQFFKEYLDKNEYNDPSLYIEIEKEGTPYYAYPDIVCMSFLEYFSFEATRTNDTAVENYRKLARLGLQQFIYKAVGYKPNDKWKHFLARVSILKDSVPDGYFSIFKETSGLSVDLINAGLTVNDHTIPDGSVGGTWGRYWTANQMGDSFGVRVQYPHYYPPEFPQSASNPQMSWAYPNEALAEFRKWFREIYLFTKYPAYILKKHQLLPGGREEALKLATMYEAKQLPSK